MALTVKFRGHWPYLGTPSKPCMGEAKSGSVKTGLSKPGVMPLLPVSIDETPTSTDVATTLVGIPLTD